VTSLAAARAATGLCFTATEGGDSKVPWRVFRVCPNCEARGPKRGSYDEALRAWNGKVKDSDVVRDKPPSRFRRWKR